MPSISHAHFHGSKRPVGTEICAAGDKGTRGAEGRASEEADAQAPDGPLLWDVDEPQYGMGMDAADVGCMAPPPCASHKRSIIATHKLGHI